jgi:hypothetical protein
MEFSRDGRSYHVTRTARKWIKKMPEVMLLKNFNKTLRVLLLEIVIFGFIKGYDSLKSKRYY